MNGTDTITELWRFPVKSIGGERLESADFGPAGIVGDRQWGLVDDATGTTLTARRAPDLLFASARIDAGQLVITLPDGTETDDDADLSRWLGKDVRLVANGDHAGDRTYEIAADFEAEDTSTWHQWTGPNWSSHDSARTHVSVVSNSTLGDWDIRRFRINVVVDRPGELDLVGQTIGLGTAGLDVLKGIDRCVMVTRPQPEGPYGDALERDLDLLRTIIRERDNVLGVGGLVSTHGTAAVGDQLTLG